MKSNSSKAVLESQIAAVRGFSRFYTKKLGIIEPKLLDSPWTLQEARIIYETAQQRRCTATDLARALGLDAGFLSRTLQALQRRQIVAVRELVQHPRLAQRERAFQQMLVEDAELACVETVERANRCDLLIGLLAGHIVGLTRPT